jgi:glucose/arabinose dehydrogenase
MALALALTGMLAPSAGAVSLQSIGAYSNPVFVTSDPSNPDRLFVVERAGKIELTTPSGTSTFLDISSTVESGYVERGLLSMAFAPDFATSGLFYVYYTGKGDGAIHVAELHASGDTADPGTIRNVITIRTRRTRITTAASSSSAPTATCTSAPATAAAAMTRPTTPRTSAACSAS